MAVQSWSHIGVCCSDLDRSTAFYVNVLGFRELFTMDLGPEFATTMEIDGTFTSRMLARPDMRLELVHWTSPDGLGDRERRPMNQFGFTHLAFRVEAIDDLWELAERFGGSRIVRRCRRWTAAVDRSPPRCTSPTRTASASNAWRAYPTCPNSEYASAGEPHRASARDLLITRR